MSACSLLLEKVGRARGFEGREMKEESHLALHELNKNRKGEYQSRGQDRRGGGFTPCV